MKIIWTQVARRDRNSIIEFIALDNIIAALDLDELITAATARISQFPNIGKVGRIQNSRELVFHEHYLLVYEIHDETIIIIALLHTSQEWPPLLH